MRKTIKASKRESIDMPVQLIAPHFSLDEDQLPEIKDWKVGEEYFILVKVKEDSAHVTPDNKVRADFMIEEAGVYDYDD